MMLPTHALVGLAIATPMLSLAPEHAIWALAGALVGSIFPDLDMYAGHRRTLHYPTGYAVGSIPVIVAAGFFRTPLLVGLAFVLVGAVLHCRMDRYGGGLELRPWEATSDRAVYDHVYDRWRRPKRWIRYDGAPEDVLFAALVGIPLVIVLEGPFQWIVIGSLLIGGTYGLLRRRLAALAPVVFGHAPEVLETHVPERYR